MKKITMNEQQINREHEGIEIADSNTTKTISFRGDHK